ncbi:hypothetical protein [Kangiella sediminilitoris]|uniref:Transmembrane protein n=1 Tax=Kangiella sediminilitoris TaxID=1144748 RepID=A0A1B3BA13_9GAMM|nr:hypothetical protein [Kangiella sediminilitoris]AOE49641.1 hypothetical protein KS2013_919 [Kangiella sediminilitoris]
MSRLLYESDKLKHVQATYEDLKGHGIKDSDLHVIAKKQGRVLRRGLNTANFWYKTNVLNGSFKGFIAGTILGLVIATTLYTAEALGGLYGTFGFVATTILFSGFGTWLGGLLGIESKNYKLRKYYDLVEEGRYLLLIDVKDNSLEDVVKSIYKNHPELILLSDEIDTVIPFDFMQTSH